MHEYSEGIIFDSILNVIEYIEKNNLYKNLDIPFTFICRFTNDWEFEILFKLVWNLENVLLVVEECEIYVSPYSKSSSFLKLVRYGRHRKISIIGIARRTSELSLDLRSQGTRIISFKQTESSDLSKMDLINLKDLDKLPLHEFKEVIL